MNVLAISKQISFYVKTCFGYFWKQFGYFSFQHLVTLNGLETGSIEIQDEFLSAFGFS